jgi:hypothetical protein
MDLAKRLEYGKLRVLFSDGESGIVENLLGRRMRHQRCVWHGKRDFPYLLHADELKKADQTPLDDQLHAVAAMTMTNAQLEKVRPQDRPRVKRIGRRWSDRGPLNWLTVSFYKIFKSELWSLQWKNAPHKLAKIRLLSVPTTYQWPAAIT